SAIIPLVAVPVAIVGTFAAMAAIGFSINNLTLFGLVLAIGIVVDDAIVVVEAVEHHIELGLPPREATLAAMKQVSGPVIAVGLAGDGLPGRTRRWCHQGALRRADARRKMPWLLPAVAAHGSAAAGWLASEPLNYALGRFFRGFNVVFRKATHGYTRLVGGLL